MLEGSRAWRRCFPKYHSLENNKGVNDRNANRFKNEVARTRTARVRRRESEAKKNKKKKQKEKGKKKKRARTRCVSRIRVNFREFKGSRTRGDCNKLAKLPAAVSLKVKRLCPLQQLRTCISRILFPSLFYRQGFYSIFSTHRVRNADRPAIFLRVKTY